MKDYFLSLRKSTALPLDTLERLSSICEKTNCASLENSFFEAGKKRNACNFSAVSSYPFGFFKDGFYPEKELFTPAKNEFESAGININEGFLALFLYISQKTLSIFKKARIDEEIFLNALKYIGKCAERFKKKNGFYGVDDYIWLSSLFVPELYHIGVLQFKLCAFPYKATTLSGTTISKNQTVIQVHVPENASLTEQNLKDSYSGAVKLFGTDIFLADSWLLFPEHKSMLDSKSSIMRFAKSYTVIDTYTTYDYEGLWRIFGKMNNYVYENLPQSTALQRAYAERVKMALPIGSAVGIMKYGKNKT